MAVSGHTAQLHSSPMPGLTLLTYPDPYRPPLSGDTAGHVLELFDATGRYRYERTLSSGLRERVLCDGTTLWHAYPDLGLSAVSPAADILAQAYPAPPSYPPAR